MSAISPISMLHDLLELSEKSVDTDSRSFLAKSYGELVANGTHGYNYFSSKNSNTIRNSNQELLLDLNEQFVKEVSPIGVETTAIYFDIAARNLSSSASQSHGRLFSSRQRAQTLPEHQELPYFISLDKHEDSDIFATMLPLLDRVELGMKSGVKPILAEGALGGTYFLRDRNRTICLVCKPGDEEPNAINNPYLLPDTPDVGQAYKGNIVPGTGLFREVAAYLLDQGFAGVPVTQLGRIYHEVLHHKPTLPVTETTVNADSYLWRAIQDQTRKLCSLQQYARHESSAEDMGCSNFNTEDVLRMAILDIRMCNLDRHEGNVLVAKSNPFSLVGSTPRIAPAIAVTNTVPVVKATATGFPSISNPHEIPTLAAAVSTKNAVEVTAGTPFYSPFSRQSIDRHSPIESCRIVDYTSLEFPSMAASAPTVSSMASMSVFFQHTPTVLTSMEVPVSRTPSPRVQIPASSPKGAGKHRLIPIDHGYTLPHVLHLDSANLCWVNWSQSKTSLSPELKRYVEMLDYEADATKLRHALGEHMLREEFMLTLFVGTYLLQVGVKEGLSLYEMGSLMLIASSDLDCCENAVSSENVGESVSPLQIAIYIAIRATLSMDKNVESVSDVELQRAIEIGGGETLRRNLRKEIELLVQQQLVRTK